MNTNTCQCGCGTKIPWTDRRGRPRRFVTGHTNKGKSNVWKIKATVTARVSHVRASKLKADVVVCEWEKIGGCMGVLDVAHVDGNEFNNEPTNLLRLCRSHHALLDRGRIDPAEPKMPPFVVRGGKRRYQYEVRREQSTG